MALLNTPQDKERSVFETLLIKEIKAIDKFNPDQKFVFDAVVEDVLLGATCTDLQGNKTSSKEKVSQNLFCSQQKGNVLCILLEVMTIVL